MPPCSRESDRHVQGAHKGDELMRLRYFLDRFQVRISIDEGENLASPVRPFGLQGHPVVTEEVRGS